MCVYMFTIPSDLQLSLAYISTDRVCVAMDEF